MAMLSHPVSSVVPAESGPESDRRPAVVQGVGACERESSVEPAGDLEALAARLEVMEARVEAADGRLQALEALIDALLRRLGV